MGLRVLMMMIVLCACASGKPMNEHKFFPWNFPKPSPPPNHPPTQIIDFLVCVFNQTDVSEFNFTKAAFEDLFSQFNWSSPCFQLLSPFSTPPTSPTPPTLPPFFPPFFNKFFSHKNSPFFPRKSYPLPKTHFPPSSLIDFLVCVFNQTDVSGFNFTKPAFEHIFSQLNSTSCVFSAFPPNHPPHKPPKKPRRNPPKKTRFLPLRFIDFLVCVFNNTDVSKFNFTKSAFEQLFSQFNSSSPCCFPRSPRSPRYPPSDRRPFSHKYSPRKNPPFSPRNPPKPKFSPTQFIDFLVCVFNHTDVSEFNFTKPAFEYLFSQFNSSSPCPLPLLPRRPPRRPFFPRKFPRIPFFGNDDNTPFSPPNNGDNDDFSFSLDDEDFYFEQPLRPWKGKNRFNRTPSRGSGWPSWSKSNNRW